MVIVDRRPNPQGKSLANRERFLERVRGDVKRAVADTIARRRVSEVDDDEEVRVRVDGTEEPGFATTPEGEHDYVLPGPGTLNRGDRIRKPQGGSGSGGSGRRAGRGSGQDAFEFTLTREEFLNFFLDELELPRLQRTSILQERLSRPQRAGITLYGQPSALDVRRTMRNSLARRIALRRPDKDEVELLQSRINKAVAVGDEATAAEARAALAEVRRRMARIPYVDPVDVRYVRHVRIPQPATEAAMFCLMDVSGSMTEHMKDLAKRFFMLLHLFLGRRYERVHVVFIRHTERAAEVDEETFFRSRETGGTLVSSALDMMLRVQEARFPRDRYNLYVAQASDGDNDTADRARVSLLMQDKILPIVRYFAYVETGGDRGVFPHNSGRRCSELWDTYESLAATTDTSHLAMRQLNDAAAVWMVLADLFAKSSGRVPA
jgi:uncharacterized sporulation protein YeaH/YhbH (DUF444 family)